MSKKRIGKVSFYCPERGVESAAGNVATFGLELLCERLKKLDGDGLLKIHAANERSAKSFDVLFVTLYWWKDIYALPRFLTKAKINPQNKKPLIVCGGIAALNPLVLSGFCNHVFVGDVDDVTGQIYEALCGKRGWDDVDGIYSFGDQVAVLQQCTELLPWQHVEHRKKPITRIEIARGCKHRCPFCVIGNYKKYVELPTTDCVEMIRCAPTKTIATFAPDRGAHSGFEIIEGAISDSGKNNMGSDIRLDTLFRHTVTTQVRFGLEGYSERLRRHIGKPWTRERFIELFLHAVNDMRKPSGDKINSLTMYLIAGLPGVNQNDIDEFWDMMVELDLKLDRKIQLFLSQSQFMGFYHTPMQYAPHDLYRDYAKEFGRSANRKERISKRLTNIVIAHRGGAIYPNRRLMMLLTIRGDERAAKIIFNIATNKKLHAASMSNKWTAVASLISACRSVGICEKDLCAERGEDFVFPWQQVTIADNEGKFWPKWERYKDYVKL